MAFKQRPVAPQPAIGWRMLFPLALIGLGIATFLLAQEGAERVLDTNAGEFIEAVRDPEEAGYEAFVKPTETLLLTVTDDDGVLVAASLLSPATDLGGGTLITIPPGLTIENPDAPFGFDLMSDVHAEGGAEVVAAELRSILGIGFAAEIELDSDDFRQLVEPYTPIVFDLAYTLERTDDDGEVTTLLEDQTALPLTADEALVVFGHRNADEEGVNRLDRQRDFFAELLVAARATSPTPDDTDEIADVRAALEQLGSAGPERVIIENLRVSQQPFAFESTAITVLQPDPDAIDAQIQAAVPLPESPEPGARPSLQLTNGVGDIEQNAAAIELLVRAGGTLAVIANTDAPDVEVSQLRYRNADQAAEAEDFAEAIGVARIIEDPTLNELVDYEFILGRDLVVR